ncbi:citrate lyase holo-[acyl-carrier protein] synthase [Orbaceae bacterium ac157xtp]
MDIQFKDGQAVTLTQMLLAKEQRVKRQQEAIKEYQSPIISLTLVIPGAIKKSSGTAFLFKQAIDAIHCHFSNHNIKIINEQYDESITGYEAIIVVDCEQNKLKEHCICIEESCDLARLWDIDVISPETQKSLSRTQFTHQPRLCLICQENAKFCSRSKRHTTDEILSVIENLVNNYIKNIKPISIIIK